MGFIAFILYQIHRESWHEKSIFQETKEFLSDKYGIANLLIIIIAVWYGWHLYSNNQVTINTQTIPPEETPTPQIAPISPNPTAIPKAPVFNWGTEITADNIFIAVNEIRYNHGLPVLIRDKELDRIAQLKADDMAENNYFAHTSPTGITNYDLFSQNIPNFKYYGENLAENFTDVQETVGAWVLSPEHLANIYNIDYIRAGVATNGSIVVEEFDSQ